MTNLFERKEINTKEKEKNYAFKFFITISIIIVLFIFSFNSKYNNFKTKVYTNEDIVVTIKPGDTFKSLDSKIDGIDDFWLDFYLKFNPTDFELQSGRYKVEAGADINQIIYSLKEPIVEEENITILEGWNIYDIDLYLTNKDFINKGNYIKYVNNIDKITKLKEFFPFLGDLQTLEGFLYPDTYTISRNNFGVNKIVIKQLENFEEKVYNKILKSLDNNTIEDLVNLASIVEKEERNSEEKSTVAGILKKRLNSGWKIGADITVCYPHKLTSEECKMVVTKYIREESEYNTRTMVGLPKTPIGNPSFETIEATLNDKETSYWFYLHNVKSGKIYYGRTNAEHEANKRFMY